MLGDADSACISGPIAIASTTDNAAQIGIELMGAIAPRCWSVSLGRIIAFVILCSTARPRFG